MHIFDIFLSPHIQLHLRDVNSKGSIDFFEQNSWISTKIKTNYPDANFAPVLRGKTRDSKAYSSYRPQN